MAEKDSKPKFTAKSDINKPKSADKSATATSKSAAKPSNVTPKSNAKPVDKPVAKKSGEVENKAVKNAAKTEVAAKEKSAEKVTPAKASKSNATTAKTTDKPVQGKAAEKTAPAKENKSDATKSKTVDKPVKEKRVKEQAIESKSTADKSTTATPKSTSKPAKNVSSKGQAKSTKLSEKNMRIIIISVVAAAIILVLILSLVLGLKSCSKNSNPPEDTDDNPFTSFDKAGTFEATQIFTAEELAMLYSYDGAKYSTTSQVGFSGKIVATCDRYKPVAEVKNESEIFSNVNGYPVYGKNMGAVTGNDPDGTKKAARQRLVNEASYLTATGTATAGGGKYTWMDKDGYLYRGTTAAPEKACYEGTDVHRQLYKHTASIGMYGGNVSDSEPGIIKQLTIRPRGYGYNVTGVYAPAGEVIKIEISGADMRATGGITIHIGQALYNGKNNNIWPEKGAMNRFPMIMNTMSLTTKTTTYDENTDTYIGYVGSFVGGPLYIRNRSVTFNVTISGGVAYRHFILGYTTEKEFEESSKSSAPYFDLEIWDRGVLHSGPLSYAKNFSYQDLYKVAVLWDKVATVTTTNGSQQGIVFLYDPFVAAGAAVAFPGQGSVNCPASWMSSALNYNAIVTSGSWGNFHEYHHNFQNYGLGSGADGEVTNNGLNLVSYSLFTKISSKRGIGSYGGQGLGGWNNYTSASWALNRVNNGAITSTNGLAVYATLLHNFGQDAYIKSRGARGSAYLDKWANNTHQDMTYYASIVRSYGFQSGGNYTPSQAVKDANYPLFVPVSSVYQTGRSYMYDNVERDIKTMQPYVITYGKNFTVDLRKYTTATDGQYLSGSIVIGNGFNYTIKKVTQPENGQLVATDTEGVYTYIPDTNSKSLRSGQIRVTLEITADVSSEIGQTYKDKVINDVDLILEFEQSHETNKMTLERTTYTYDASKMYTDAVDAYSKGFAGYSTVEKKDHSNPTQNANTDIWFYPNTTENRNKYPNAPESYFIHDNTIEVIDGKLYFDDDGKYRVYLRGRTDCALYFSLDGNSYSLGAKIKEATAPKNSAQFRPNDNNTYFDIQFDEGDVTVTVYVNGEKTYNYTIAIKDGKYEIENWLYIKEVLIVKTSSSSYIGVGMKQWTEAMFTMSEKRYNSDNVEIDPESNDYAENYAYSKTIYCNQAGSEVAYSQQDKGSSTISYYKKSGNNWVATTLEDVTELTRTRKDPPTLNTQPYVNAYRRSYEFPDNKGFTSEYFYTRSYNYNFSYTDRVDYNAGKKIISISHQGTSAFPTENLVDGKTGTGFHSSGTDSKHKISANNPFELKVDLGEVVKANHVTFYYFSHSTSNNKKNNVGMVKTFTLQGSLSGEEGDWFDITSKTDYMNEKSPSNVTFDFDTKEFRYYKLTVTATDNGTHFAMNEIVFYYHNPENDLTLNGNGANNLSLDDRSRYHFFDENGIENEWRSTSGTSIFGHIYVGKENSMLTFEFTGTRIGFITSTAQEYKNEYDVYIDGKKVNSNALLPVSGAFGITYLSEKLESKTHTVTMICKSVVGIDSIVYYNETN